MFTPSYDPSIFVMSSGPLTSATMLKIASSVAIVAVHFSAIVRTEPSASNERSSARFSHFASKMVAGVPAAATRTYCSGTASQP
jgi:hypothetical protein